MYPWALVNFWGSKFNYMLVFLFFKVNKALILDQNKKQWVDLGIHTEACMTRPETCGAAGGAVSLWMRVIDCPSTGGIVSSYVDFKSYFVIYCETNLVW